MATSASRFRPNGPTRLDVGAPAAATPELSAPVLANSTLRIDVIEPPAPAVADGSEGAAVEFEVRVPPSGEVTVLSGRQRVSLHQAMAVNIQLLC
jgi:hypothetical protein